jgi:hypothetical protein
MKGERADEKRLLFSAAGAAERNSGRKNPVSRVYRGSIVTRAAARFRTSRWLLAGALVVVSAAAALGAQRFIPGFAYEPPVDNLPYDGRFTFVRLKYTSGPGGYYFHGLPAWAHGYNRAEANLSRILDSISAVHPHMDGSNVFALDDPRLFEYPVAYMTEAGYWEMSDKEALAFRAYLQKGGFVIFDDFRPPPRGGRGWDQLEENMRRVLPNARIEPLTPSDPIFHTFFDIDSFEILPQAYDGGSPVISGIYDDNDPHRRLMAIINFNTDVSEFWELANTGYMPVADSNEAYKLGVNYIIYGLTH